jgi:hypothetical protein
LQGHTQKIVIADELVQTDHYTIPRQYRQF